MHTGIYLKSWWLHTKAYMDWNWNSAAENLPKLYVHKLIFKREAWSKMPRSVRPYSNTSKDNETQSNMRWSWTNPKRDGMQTLATSWCGTNLQAARVERVEKEEIVEIHVIFPELYSAHSSSCIIKKKRHFSPVMNFTHHMIRAQLY